MSDAALEYLEQEALFYLRESVAKFVRPVLLFSGGKDSTVLLHLAAKAFAPDSIPFPILHVDTGYNFPELLSFRDSRVNHFGVQLIVASVERAVADGRVEDDPENPAHRNRLQSQVLHDAIQEQGFDVVIGGARRDEEKARAKERFFSHRGEDGGWNPLMQRPEPWRLANTQKARGEHFRLFPLNNWTERDVWEYIKQESIEVPSLYFAHEHEIDGGKRQVRFRTIADMPCSTPIHSAASTVDEILAELDGVSSCERGGRLDDVFSETAMEERKREGYF